MRLKKLSKVDEEWIKSILEVPEGTELKKFSQEEFDSYWKKVAQESAKRIAEYKVPQRLQEIFDEICKNDKGYKYLIRDINEENIFAYMDIIEKNNTLRWFIGTKYDDCLCICCHTNDEVIYALGKMIEMKELKGNGEITLSNQFQKLDDPFHTIEPFNKKLDFKNN